jgi:hypothetical protein
VRSLFAELAGDGGVQPHRLSPKGHPELDLLTADGWLRHAHRDVEANGARLPAEMSALLCSMRIDRDKWTRPVDPYGRLPWDLVGGFLCDVLQTIGGEFELVPLAFDGAGVVHEGADITPGLTTARDPEEIKEGITCARTRR